MTKEKKRHPLRILIVLAVLAVCGGWNFIPSGNPTKNEAALRTFTQIVQLEAGATLFHIDHPLRLTNTANWVAELTGGEGATINTNGRSYVKLAATNAVLMDGWNRPIRVITTTNSRGPRLEFYSPGADGLSANQDDINSWDDPKVWQEIYPIHRRIPWRPLFWFSVTGVWVGYIFYRRRPQAART